MGNDQNPVSRRRLLGVVGGTLAASATVTTRASATDGRPAWGRCPEATIRPSHGHCEGADHDGCTDDREETVALREAVAETLADRYPDAGELLDAGFVPYFDALDFGEEGWSHWINPEYVGDDVVLDPDRPESVLVDNDSWRSIGVMFIAVRDGEPIDDPPAVYEDDDERCAPWHYHAGLPGRFAWWYYQRVYENEERDHGGSGHGDDDHEPGARGGGPDGGLPCRTPCMLHVWTVDHPEGTYAHGGPPAESRDLEPAAAAGFETDAEPGRDALGWDVLPDSAVPDRRPAELRDWWP